MSVEVIHYGHAAFGIFGGGYRLLTDPWFTGNEFASITAQAAQADFILVTHGHSDHLGDSIGISRRTGATIIAPFELARYAQGEGAKAEGYYIGGGPELPFGNVKLTLATHGSSLPDGSYAGVACGFLFTLAGKHFYFAGDTGLFLDMQLIGEDRSLDVAMLPIGGRYTMEARDAVRAVKLLSPKIVIPMHYQRVGVDPRPFAEDVERETPSQCAILAPGESLTLED